MDTSTAQQREKDLPRWEALVNAIVERLPDVLAVYRFGTWGTRYQRSDSDIDLAIFPATPLDPMPRWELAQSLASLLGRDVDLVDMRAASTVMRAQIIAHGTRLYCREALLCTTFENYVFAAYARLNEERREIVQDIQRRGRVYGR